MLELRPHCENCGTPLAPESTDAMICSFECTFCRSCVQSVLSNVCPNCGGGFCERPVRPARRWKDQNYLGAVPASTKSVVKPVNASVHQAFAADIQDIPPSER